MIYNPFDVFIVQRNETSTSFVERVLPSAPNSLFYFDSNKNVGSLSTASITAGTAISTSYADKSHLSDTASFALNAATTTSFANAAVSASYASSSTRADSTTNYVNPSAIGNSFYSFPYWRHDGTLKAYSYLSVTAPNGSVSPEDESYNFHLNGNSGDLVPATPGEEPILTINQAYPFFTTTNLIAGYGYVDGQLKIVIQNLDAEPSSSTDFIAQSDDSGSYVNLGIVNTQFTASNNLPISPNDAYLQVSKGNLLLRVADSSKAIKFAFGSFIPFSVDSNGIKATGSLFGTSSWANHITPGATLYVVSSSTNPSYIEPYNIPTVPYYPPYKEGRMFYDKDYSNWVYYTDQDFKLHVGKEVIWRVYNPHAFTIPSTTVVYLSGSTDGKNPDVYEAVADGTNTKSDVVGIIRHDIDPGTTGYVLQVGVVHDVDMTGFNIGDVLWLSPDTPGHVTKTEPGEPFESVRVGICQASGQSGSFIVDATKLPPPPNAYSGLTTIPTITNNNDGTITLSTSSCNLYNNSQAIGGVTGYPIAAATLTLATGSNVSNYISVDYNSGHPIYTVNQFNTADSLAIVGVAIVNARKNGPGDWDTDYVQATTSGLGLANKLLSKDARLNGIQRQSGMTLFETSSLGVGITAGLAWRGVAQFSVPAVDSVSGNYEFYFFYHSGSDWGFQTTSSGVITNKYYDNGTGLSQLSNSYYNAAFVYRLIGTLDEFVYVLATNQYATLNDAQQAQPPGDIPSYISSLGLLVGRIIVQSGSLNSARIDSAFTTTFIPTEVNNHNNLLGLQGGKGGEYYHLTLADFNGSGTGSMVRQFAPTMSSPQFLGATPGHIPFWQDNQTLTLTGSVQVISDTPGTPREHVMLNSASFPDITNPETLLVRQTHSGSVNNIGACATINNFSQIYNQNLSNGPSASTDIVATADNGNQVSAYVDMGIASSQYNDSRWPWLKPNDSYLENDGGDLWIAGLSTNKYIRFITDNENEAGWVYNGKFYITGSLNGSASYSFNTQTAISSSWASSSISSSWADSSSFATYVNIFAGLTSDINIIDNNNGTVTVSTGSVNLFSDFDGNGPVLNYLLPETIFTVQSGSAQYIVVNYNNGTPIYQITSDLSIINQTTIIPAAVLTNIRGEIRGYGYDNVGLALANRLNNRESKIYGLIRQNGLLLFNTGSGFMGVTQGNVWDGATQVFEPDFNSMYWADSNPVVNENYFYHHTASLPSNQFAIEEAAVQWNQWITNYYDSGTDLVPMSASYYVVNYVWRLIGGISPDEDMSSLVGGQYATLNEARAEAVPVAPSDVTELGILIGRAICQSGSAIPVLIESAFATTFQASTVTNHENLDGLEGGTVNQHYHLTLAEYNGTGTGVFVRQSGSIITGSITSASFAPVQPSYSSSVSAEFATKQPNLITANTYPITSSWSQRSVSSSYAPVDPSYSASVSVQFGTKQDTLVVGNTYNITSSWANNSTSASWAPPTPTSPSASWASASISSSYAGFAQNSSNALTANTASYAFFALTSSVTIVTQSTTTASVSSSYAVNADTASLAFNAISASWSPNQGATTLVTASTYQITSSWATNALTAANAGTTLVTASIYSVTASWANNATSASFAPVQPSYSASVSTQFGTKQPNLVTGNTYTITSSWANNATSASSAPVDSTYSASVSTEFGTKQPNLVTGNTYTITSSWANNATNAVTSTSSSWASSSINSSTAISASYAHTASVMNTEVLDILSGSNYTNATTAGTSTALTFTAQPNEIWVVRGGLSVQCSGNGGIKYAVSASTTVAFIEAWFDGATNAITATTRQRLTTINTLTTTAMNTQATTPADAAYWFTVINGGNINTISIAAASNTGGQTTTVFAGSYMIAKKFGIN